MLAAFNDPDAIWLLALPIGAVCILIGIVTFRAWYLRKFTRAGIVSTSVKRKPYTSSHSSDEQLLAQEDPEARSGERAVMTFLAGGIGVMIFGLPLGMFLVGLVGHEDVGSRLAGRILMILCCAMGFAMFGGTTWWLTRPKQQG